MDFVTLQKVGEATMGGFINSEIYMLRNPANADTISEFLLCIGWKEAA